MTTDQIRDKYLKYFEGKGHKIVSSDLLVPKNDPTLLFTGAGMNQFKEQFMGRNITFKRAVSCQKCLRTGDLENVGKTPRHHTFFEMLGNFSFGDYFKKEAIEWGWGFMTKELGIPEERLWISVYKDDDESYDIWKDHMNIPVERIVKLSAKDNFWPADAPTKGPNGPCGPCSEIFYDWGEDIGCESGECTPECDCGRFVEVWNLVFTEFERKSDGSLVSLPNKNIDTGMGLERIVSVIQDVRTNFDTDLFVKIIDEIKNSLKDVDKELGSSELNLIADHLRAAVFCICDGVSPSNEKQGYVVRKLIRRAFLKSGSDEPFFYNLVPVVVRVLKGVYPELQEKREHISAIVEAEEKRFCVTLSSAMPVFENMIKDQGKVLAGENVFKLVDTYGMPLEVIQDEAEDRGLELDIAGFEELMHKRKEQSRKGSDITSDFIFQPDLFDSAPSPDYSQDVPLDATIEFILKGDKPADKILEGEEAEIITSPQSSEFYAESGGQVGDKGCVKKGDATLRIVNTFVAGGKKILQVKAVSGDFAKGEQVTLDIDDERKAKTARNHTATHLLQAALRKVIGDTVKQSGSYVDDRRLRFDFTHMKKLSDRDIMRVEDMVNGWISNGIGVSKDVKSIETAKAEGALSFFGEKYGDTVRVVSIGDSSKEFCGGTHVDNTRDIGLVKVTSESAVASGIRRIEALTNDAAKVWVVDSLKRMTDEFMELASAIGQEADLGFMDEVGNIVAGTKDVDKDVIHEYDETFKPELTRAMEKLRKATKKKEKETSANQFAETTHMLDDILNQPEDVSGISVLSKVLDGMDMGTLRKAAGYLERKMSSGVVLLAGSREEKTCFICVVTKDIVDKGVNAGDIIKGIGPIIGGGGGGKPTFAQAGGKDPEKLIPAIEEAKELIKKGIE